MRRSLVLFLTTLLALAGLTLVMPPAQAAVLDRQITVSSDDAEQRSLNTSLTSTDLEIVQDGSTHQTVGLRFPSMTIPPGSTITRAYVQFTAAKSHSTAVTLTIAGHDLDNAGTFTTAATSVSGRPVTTATAAWTPPAWSSGTRGTAQRTSELKTIVQEVVNRPGWASGNALSFQITTPSTNYRHAYAFDNGTASRAPALHVEWTTGTPPPPPAACADGADNDGDAKIDYPADPGCGSTTDTDEIDPVTSPPPPPIGTEPTPASYGFPDCFGTGRSVLTARQPGTYSTALTVRDTGDNETYDLRGVESTAFPSSSHPFSFGTGSDNLDAGARTCAVGGELLDRVGYPPRQTWDWYHDEANAACIKVAALHWYQILNTSCAGVEDGIRPQEPGVNANNARFAVSDVYLRNVLDDCVENDYIVGGVIMDSLFEECYSGISERPSSDRCWVTPPGEQLVLDHLLLGLRPMNHDDGVNGYGRLFKFAKCAEDGDPLTHNQLVLKCSTFLVPDRRREGDTEGMAVPVGTIVDDSACPNDPTTIVWLGGGSYPGDLRGLPIRVTSDRTVWDNAVATWKTAHGH